MQHFKKIVGGNLSFMLFTCNFHVNLTCYLSVIYLHVLPQTGEMEIRNPLFRGEETPVTPGQDITGQPHEEHPPPAPERGNL